jgi:hypothetical protein
MLPDYSVNHVPGLYRTASNVWFMPTGNLEWR